MHTLEPRKENRDDKLDASVNQLEESREGNEGASFHDDASAAIPAFFQTRTVYLDMELMIS